MTDLAIQALNLCKDFGHVKAVQSLNLEIPRSRIYGFLGPNGSGKTTAIRMLCGLLTPTSGEIDVLGYSIPDEAEALRVKVGYMTQKFSLFEDLTVAENLQFMADIYTLGRKLKNQRIGLATERYKLDDFLKQRAGTLSGGQKQRLALAACTLHEPELLFLDEPTSACTLHEPELLFLDEPTSAVDPENRRAFWESLFDLVGEGTTILVSTHYMDEAERCHALAILDKGTLVAEGSPEELQRGIDASIVVVESEQPRKVGKMLEQLPFVHSSAQVGKLLRVMVAIDQSSPDKAVSDAITHAGLSLKSCDITQPGLEDVFVAATRASKEKT
jgi:ABC-2 type transport system ATP-binding protein